MHLTIIPAFFKSVLKFISNIADFIGAIQAGDAASGVPSLLLALLAMVPFIVALIFFIVVKKRVVKALITILLVLLSGGMEYLFSFRPDLVPAIFLSDLFVKVGVVILSLTLSLILFYLISGLFHRKSRNRMDDDDDEYDDDEEYEDEEEYVDEEAEE